MIVIQVRYKIQRFILDFTEFYDLVGTGKTCNNESVYTKNGCDGFLVSSLEECKERCSFNDNPPECPTSNVCKYVLWNPFGRICHFASDECNIILTESSSNMSSSSCNNIGCLMNNMQQMQQLWIKHYGVSSKFKYLHFKK